MGDGLRAWKQSDAGARTYSLHDGSDPVAELDAGGTVLSTDVYDAFGARQSTAPANDPWGFGAQWGYQTDGETGLVLCTNRFYDPQQGRFLTRDPLGYAGRQPLQLHAEQSRESPRPDRLLIVIWFIRLRR